MRFLAVVCAVGGLSLAGAANAHPAVSGHLEIHDGPVSIGLHLPPWHHARAHRHRRHYPHYAPHPRRHSPWGHHGPPRHHPYRHDDRYAPTAHRGGHGHRAPRGHRHGDECYLFYQRGHPHWGH